MIVTQQITNLIKKTPIIFVAAIIAFSSFTSVAIGQASDFPITPPITPPVTPPTTPSPTPTPPVTPPTSDINLPKITTNRLSSGRVNKPYFKRIKVTQREPNVEFEIAAIGLPDNLELDHCFHRSTRRKTTAYCYIKGIPQEEGEFDVSIMAESSTGHTTSKDYVLKIKKSRFRYFPWRNKWGR